MSAKYPKKRIWGHYKLLCKMLDKIYEITIVDPSEEKYFYWNDLKMEIIHKIGIGLQLPDICILGALDAIDGVRKQLWSGNRINSYAIMKELEWQVNNNPLHPHYRHKKSAE